MGTRIILGREATGSPMDSLEILRHSDWLPFSLRQTEQQRSQDE